MDTGEVHDRKDLGAGQPLRLGDHDGLLGLVLGRVRTKQRIKMVGI